MWSIKLAQRDLKDGLITRLSMDSLKMVFRSQPSIGSAKGYVKMVQAALHPTLSL